MAKVQNQVDTKFTISGGAEKGAAALSQRFEGLGSVIQKAQGLINPLTAALGGLAGAMGAKAILDMGDKFEQTQITMAGFLSSLKISENYEAGFKDAQKVMEQIRVSAAALPGEAEEYVDVFKSTLPTVQKAIGGTVSQMTAFTNRYTAIAKTLQVDSQQAARDLQLMLREGAGGAGMDVRTFMQLLPFMKQVDKQADLTREKFNKMTQADRAKLLQETFKKLDPMLEKSANSFDAMSGGLKSSLKEMVKLGSAPLFEEAKRQLGIVNGLLYDDNGQITEFGQNVVDVGKAISEKIVWALQLGERVVRRIPALFNQISKTPGFNALHQLFLMIEKVVSCLGRSMAGFAGLPGMLIPEAGKVNKGPEMDLFVGALGIASVALLGLGPFGIVISATVAQLVKTKGAVSSVIDSLSRIGAVIVHSVKGPLSHLAIWGQMFAEWVPPITAALAGLFEVLLPLWDGFWNIANLILQKAKPGFDALMKAIKEFITSLTQYLNPVIRILVGIFTKASDTLGKVFNVLAIGFAGLIKALNAFLRMMGKLLDKAADHFKLPKLTTGGFLGGLFGERRSHMATAEGDIIDPKTGKPVSAAPKAPSGARGGGGRAVNDFKFSRFEITQKFAEGFDPDRIAIAFSRDVGRLGEQRLQSGFEPLFSIK